MTLWHFPAGYYGDDGHWQATKHCFVYCGDRCDCGPPLGVQYSEPHDVRLQAMKCAGAAMAERATQNGSSASKRSGER